MAKTGTRCPFCGVDLLECGNEPHKESCQLKRGRHRKQETQETTLEWVSTSDEEAMKDPKYVTGFFLGELTTERQIRPVLKSVTGDYFLQGAGTRVEVVSIARYQDSGPR